MVSVGLRRTSVCVGGIPLPLYYLPRKDQCRWYVSYPLVRLWAKVVWWLFQNTDSCRPFWLIDSSVTQGPWRLSPCWSLFLGWDFFWTILLSLLYTYMCSWFTLQGGSGGPHSSLETEKWERICIGPVWLCAKQFSASFKGCVGPGLLTELSFTLLVESSHGETPTGFTEYTYCGNLILLLHWANELANSHSVKPCFNSCLAPK